jgi:hypothetical protein
VQMERARVLDTLARRADAHGGPITQMPGLAGEPTGRATSARGGPVAADTPVRKMVTPHADAKGGR